MRNAPEGWPGTGEPPRLNGMHAAPYTLNEAKWLHAALQWLDARHMDARRKATCRLVLLYMLAHVESRDSLTDGRPFASVSNTMLSKEIERSRDTVGKAVDDLTVEGGPLAVVWKQSQGQRIGACYRFDMPDIPMELPDTSHMPDNPIELPDMCDVSDGMPDMQGNSTDMQGNSTDMQGNSTDMTDNSLGDSRHSIPNPNSSRRVASQTQRDAPAAVKRSRIDTHSVLTADELAEWQAAMQADNQAVVLDRPPF